MNGNGVVLIVDDHAPLARSLVSLFSASGFDAQAAQSAPDLPQMDPTIERRPAGAFEAASAQVGPLPTRDEPRWAINESIATCPDCANRVR